MIEKLPSQPPETAEQRETAPPIADMSNLKAETSHILGSYSDEDCRKAAEALGSISNEADLALAKEVQENEKHERRLKVPSYYMDTLFVSRDDIEAGWGALMENLDTIVESADIAAELDSHFDSDERLQKIKQMYIDMFIMKISEHIRHYTNRDDIEESEKIALGRFLIQIERQTQYIDGSQPEVSFRSFQEIHNRLELLDSVVQKNKFTYTKTNGKTVICPPTIAAIHKQSLDHRNKEIQNAAY